MDFEIKFQSPFYIRMWEKHILLIADFFLIRYLMKREYCSLITGNTSLATFSIAEDIIEKGSPLGAGGLHIIFFYSSFHFQGQRL
jgi:hypothetical protein